MVNKCQPPKRTRQVLTRCLILLSSLLVFYSPFTTANKSHEALSLEGKSFDGSIRANGFLGLISVSGNLSFEDGLLIWRAKNSEDKGVYRVYDNQWTIRFSASLIIDRNERVEWSGTYDGNSVYDVEAVWNREKGDFLHDLLLPEVVTLEFTARKN